MKNAKGHTELELNWDCFVATGEKYGWRSDDIVRLREPPGGSGPIIEAGWNEFVLICIELQWMRRLILEGNAKAAVIVAMREVMTAERRPRGPS